MNLAVVGRGQGGQKREDVLPILEDFSHSNEAHHAVLVSGNPPIRFMARIKYLKLSFAYRIYLSTLVLTIATSKLSQGNGSVV